MQRCRVLTGMRVRQVTGVGGQESVFTLVHSFRGTDLAGHRWILQLNRHAFDHCGSVSSYISTSLTALVDGRFTYDMMRVVT
jgi:hypothetical protein